jgi:hypothetical protein
MRNRGQEIKYRWEFPRLDGSQAYDPAVMFRGLFHRVPQEIAFFVTYNLD